MTQSNSESTVSTEPRRSSTSASAASFAVKDTEVLFRAFKLQGEGLAWLVEYLDSSEPPNNSSLIPVE